MKMYIKVLGSGCSRCKSLHKITTDVVGKLNIDAEIEKVEDITRIMGYGIMATPALIINEKVIIKGRVPDEKELTGIILSHQNQ
jgi:small redox-active disulfide protein 2